MFLGIDLGSSFIKSALFDLERSRVLDIRKTVTTGFIPHELPHKEIRPEEITSAVQAIIREAAARQELQGIVLSSQMQGLLLKDARGNKLTNFISWQDSRGMERRPDGTSILDRIARTVPAEAMVAGGIQLKSIHSICPLVALLEDGAPRDARVLLLGDVVAEALTGEPSRIDPGMAASSGLYSLQTGEWNLPLLEALGLQHLHLPPIAQGREPLGYFSAAGQRIPIYPAALK
jgi:sugar (pentulose or hexulose) kinase